MTDKCPTYWGSHGCVLERGHDGWHYCGDESGPCCRLTQDGKGIAHWDDAYREWFNVHPYDPSLVYYG